MPLFPRGAGATPVPASPLPEPRPCRRGFVRLLSLAACLSGAALIAAAPAGKIERGKNEAPWVLVDYSTRSGSYRVVGDVTLLSRRFSPGTTFDLIVAAVALDSGSLTASTQIPCRTQGDASREATLTVARALRESNDDFFSQVLKKMGYEPIREFLVAARFTPGVPEAVSSFAELARGEPLRVTVFEQNLFLQALVRRELPLADGHADDLERWLALEGRRGTWGKEGDGEASSDSPVRISWFNGAAAMRDGNHVVTVVALSPEEGQSARDRFLRYLASPRR